MTGIFEPIAGIKPVRPTPSLLTVARGIPNPGRWQSGVAWRSAACAVGARWPMCPDSDAEKNTAGQIVAPQVTPFVVYVPYACDWVLPDQESDYRADARNQCDAVTPWHVSRELWTGATEAANDSLQSVATDVSASDPVHPVTAVMSLLEAYFDCPVDDEATGRGTNTPVIHAPMFAIVSLLAHGVIAQQGDVYAGPNCVVSPGPGYPSGTAGRPTGVDEGSEEGWLYVSGPVEYVLDDIIVRDVMQNRRMNRYEAIAEREALVRFDPCCVFAVKVYQPSPSDSESV